MPHKERAPGVMTTRAGAVVENAGLGDGEHAFVSHDSDHLPQRQRSETCAHCRRLRPVRGWVFAAVCEPCYSDEQDRIERNRARRRRQG